MFQEMLDLDHKRELLNVRLIELMHKGFKEDTMGPGWRPIALLNVSSIVLLQSIKYCNRSYLNYKGFVNNNFIILVPYYFLMEIIQVNYNFCTFLTNRHMIHFILLLGTCCYIMVFDVLFLCARFANLVQLDNLCL